MITSMTRPPKAGVADDIWDEDEREGWSDGPEGRAPFHAPTQEQRLSALLLADVRRGDRIAAAAGRTTPRTLAQMQARLAEDGGAQ